MAIAMPLFVIAGLIFLNGLFVAAEFAIVAAPRTRMAQLAAEGSAVARRIMAIQNNPTLQNRYITTAQVGITLVSLGLGMYGEHAIADSLLGMMGRLGSLAEPVSHVIASVCAVGLLTYIHVVLGEMIPKSLALGAPESAVLVLNRPMGILQIIFFPLVWVLTGLAAAVTRLGGVSSNPAKSRALSPRELEIIAEESSEEGLLPSSEQLYLENILDLRERTVEDVMTPRNRIDAIPLALSEAQIMEIICRGNRSRYPVYDGSIDQIVGILHIKDLARQRVRYRESGQEEWYKVLRPAVFVPETLPLIRLLIRFRRERLQMAVVIDESGGVAGIVTLEDLVEEVVGEIQDEFDREMDPITRTSDGRLRVRGDVILDELNQLYDIALSHPEAHTIGGLLMALLGRIPRSGDRVRYGEVDFEVETVSHHAVQSVLVDVPSGNVPTTIDHEQNDSNVVQRSGERSSQ